MRIGQLFRKIAWLGRLRACPDCTCRFSFPEAAGHWLCCTCCGPAPAFSTFLGLGTGPGLLHILLPHSTPCSLFNNPERPACRTSHLMLYNCVPIEGTEMQQLFVPLSCCHRHGRTLLAMVPLDSVSVLMIMSWYLFLLDRSGRVISQMSRDLQLH